MNEDEKMNKINDILKKSGDMFMVNDNLGNHETIDPNSMPNNMLAAQLKNSNIFDE